MKKKIKAHTEEGFVRGFSRHFLCEMIAESDSFENFNKTLIRTFPEDCEGYKEVLFQEFRFLNIIFLVQQIIPEIVGKAYENGHISNEPSLELRVVKNIKRNFRTNNEEDARKLLKNETSGSLCRIYTPYVFLELAGFGLGDLIDILRNHITTKEIFGNEDLFIRLSEINNKRNILVHNIASSRMDMNKELGNAIDVANKVFRALRDIHCQYLGIKNF